MYKTLKCVNTAFWNYLLKYSITRLSDVYIVASTVRYNKTLIVDPLEIKEITHWLLKFY